MRKSPIMGVSSGGVPMQVKGWTLRLGRFHIRIWTRGIEWGDQFGGRMKLFPWARWGTRRYLR